MDKLDGKTMNLTEINIQRLKELFPEILVDGKIDFDKLRLLLGEEVELSNERYQFSWNGKNNTIKFTQTPTTSTLLPDINSSVDWQNTDNLYLEGDNVEVLKILQKTYFGKIKMIYIDPPYNTGHDFVYKDDFVNNIENYKKVTSQKQNANPDTSGRFHTDWLNMIYSRLKLAKELLSDDGVIFISIDDNEVDNLKKVCSEIFGENNFIGCAGRITKKSNNKGDFWAPNFDYLLTYAKNRDECTPFTGGANEDSYNLIEEEGPRKGERYQLVRLYMSSLKNRNPEQRFWIECPDGSKIIPPGTTFPPERPNLGDGIWRWTRTKFEAEKDKIVIKRVSSSNLLDENHQPAKWNVFTKTYLNDVLKNSSAKPNSFIEEHINQIASHELNDLGIPFDYAKPTSLIKYLMEVSQVKDGDIVLDFFSGSASTADAVMQYNVEKNINVKFIMVQLPEEIDETQKANKFLCGLNKKPIITELGKERIRRAGQRLIKELEEKFDNAGLLVDDCANPNDFDFGFKVFRLDTTNIKPWDGESKVDEITIFDFNETIKEDRTQLDVAYEIMLKYGIFDMPLTEITIANKKMYNVGDGYMIICLDNNITAEDVIEIAKQKPHCVVFKEKGFEDDNVKINATYTLERMGVEDVKCI